MSGLLRRLSRRRSATADESRSPAIESSEPVAAPADTPAEAGGQQPVPGPDQPTQVIAPTTDQPAVAPAPAEAPEQPTVFAAQPPPARDLPAGVDPADLVAAPAPSARRGKLRRRLRYLRQVRELLLRDLGGFTYEIHRTAGGSMQESHRVLAAAKAKRLSSLDDEVVALETRLGEPHAETLLREPGIGGICPQCGELHASDAHFCSRCGEPLDARARALRESAIAAAAQPTTGSHDVVEPQPASVLWAGGPRPAAPAGEEQPEEAEKPAAVTSAWLATDQPTTLDEPAPAKPKPASKPRKPAKRASTRPAGPAPEAEAEETPKAADEPKTVVEEPKPADEPKPKADEKPDDTAANGHRDERVPRPVTSGDPLATPREQK